MNDSVKHGSPAPVESPWTEHRIEQLIGRLLQVGVIVASAIVLVGGVLLVVRHGASIPDYRVFRGSEQALRGLSSILGNVLTGDPRAIVQLGIIVLIATPILRVALMVVAFALQKDRLYVMLTTIVLALLLYGFFFGS